MAKNQQLKMQEVKKVPLNLVQGEFWSRKYSLKDGTVLQPGSDKYFELREIQLENGIIEKLVEVDYPITPDYVKSFASSCDYRNDIDAALNSPPRGQNLGDVTSLQDILSMDLSSVRDMQAKLAEVEKTLQSAQSAQSAQNIQNEVNNNG